MPFVLCFYILTRCISLKKSYFIKQVRPQNIATQNIYLSDPSKVTQDQSLSGVKLAPVQSFLSPLLVA